MARLGAVAACTIVLFIATLAGAACCLAQEDGQTDQSSERPQSAEMNMQQTDADGAKPTMNEGAMSGGMVMK